MASLIEKLTAEEGGESVSKYAPFSCLDYVCLLFSPIWQLNTHPIRVLERHCCAAMASYQCCRQQDVERHRRAHVREYASWAAIEPSLHQD